MKLPKLSCYTILILIAMVVLTTLVMVNAVQTKEPRRSKEAAKFRDASIVRRKRQAEDDEPEEEPAASDTNDAPPEEETPSPESTDAPPEDDEISPPPEPTNAPPEDETSPPPEPTNAPPEEVSSPDSTDGTTEVQTPVPESSDAPAEEETTPSSPNNAGRMNTLASGASGGSTNSAPVDSTPSDAPVGGLISDEEFEAEPPQDPFSILKWTQFKTRAKHIQDALLKLTDNIISAQSSSSTSNGGGDGTNTNLNMKEFVGSIQSLSQFFVPLDEELFDSIPYTLINPTVDLYTRQLLNGLATTKPTKLRDRTRLKWVEVNALAITTHYSFERIFRLLNSQDGDTADIREALKIEYPSWIEEINTNDTEAYQLMNIEAIIERIHGQFDVLGEKYQLLRGLEKLLRKKLKDLNPEKTDLNLYCYGNNDYIMVYDVPDLLTDAALYLIMADMKYFVIQLLNTIASNAADKTQEYDKFKQALSVRIEKKISIGQPVEAPEPAPASGPTLFPCDPHPKPGPNETNICISSPLSPDVHIIDNVPTLVESNQPAQLDPATKHPLYTNGTKIPGIDVVRQFFSMDGTPIASNSNTEMILTTSEDGSKVLDSNGTVIEGATVQILYIPYDDLPRGDVVPTYAKIEWGKFGCNISPNSSTPKIVNDPPFGPPPPRTPPPPGTPPPPDTPPPGTPPSTKDGFPDNRLPDYYAAQFSLAYSGYIEAELVLNHGHGCAGTCRDYHSIHGTSTACNAMSSESCDIYRDSMCDPRGTTGCLQKSQCNGRARRCVRTASVVEICETELEKNATRLYDWIKFSDGRIITAVDQSTLAVAPATGSSDDEEGVVTLGEREPKPKEEKGLSCGRKAQVAAERWQMDFGVILAAPEYCELCMCVCDGPMVPEGHHVFGLEPITSKEGYVITAVRFEQIGNSMQLNVEQAKWVGNGHVDMTTKEWLQPPEVDKSAKEESWAKLGRDGFTKMNIDSVFVASNEVVTGIRVVLEGDALSIQVQGTPVQEDDTLGATPSEWKGVDSNTKRQEIDLSDAESSIKQRGPSQPLYHFYDPESTNTTQQGSYVRFDASSLLKDGGQSVVPFFDLQAAHHHFENRKALQGVGISYKAKNGYGGFLVPAVNIYKKYF